MVLSGENTIYNSLTNICNRAKHSGQNSKQINVAINISKFLMYGAKMLDKYVKKRIVHCPFLQSQAMYTTF